MIKVLKASVKDLLMNIRIQNKFVNKITERFKGRFIELIIIKQL